MESVDLLVGDLDSVKAEIFARPKQVERHSVDEDATDLELALAAALRLEPDRIRSSEAPGPARPSPRRVREYRLVG
jgi:thiamine pyrophosphokinase